MSNREIQINIAPRWGGGGGGGVWESLHSFAGEAN